MTDELSGRRAEKITRCADTGHNFEQDDEGYHCTRCPLRVNAPVRLCCGKRHHGVQCPDGKVMCCICFQRFEVSELSLTPEGKPVDVCKDCAQQEAEVMAQIDGEPRE